MCAAQEAITDSQVLNDYDPDRIVLYSPNFRVSI
jgi:hypothetical protein